MPIPTNQCMPRRERASLSRRDLVRLGGAGLVSIQSWWASSAISAASSARENAAAIALRMADPELRSPTLLSPPAAVMPRHWRAPASGYQCCLAVARAAERCQYCHSRAAMLDVLARDRGEVPVLFQLLIMPMLDDRTGSMRPASPGVGTFVWTAASNRYCWSSFLGVPAGTRRVPAGAVPARMADVRGLRPPISGSARSTSSSTRISTIPEGWWPPACRQNSMSWRAPTTSSLRLSRTPMCRSDSGRRSPMRWNAPSGHRSDLRRIRG